MRALQVVFGTGPLGRALLSAISSRGHRARVIDLRGVPLEVPAGVQVWRGDPADAAWVASACAEASAVHEVLDSTVRRTARVRAAITAGIAASGARAVRLERLERAGDHADDPNVRLGEDVVVGRVGDMFGAGWDEGPLSASALRSLRNDGKVSIPGNPDLPHTWAYLPDVAHGLVVLGEAPEAVAQAWHLPAAPALTTRELLRLACEAAGRPGGMPRLKISRSEPRFQAPLHVSHARFAETFGPEAALVTPLRVAIREAVEAAG